MDLYALASTTIEEKTEIIILTNRKIFDRWIDFMHDIAMRFRQFLWKERKTNPAIQHYLKS